MKNKKLVIVLVLVLALICCGVSLVGGLIYLSQKGISTVQSSIKDNIRRSFVQDLNLGANQFYLVNEDFPKESEVLVYTDYVSIGGDVIEFEDKTLDLTDNFCYEIDSKTNIYTFGIVLESGDVFNLGNGSAVCRP